MKVYYHLSQYISHKLSGLDFIASLRGLHHEVVTDIHEMPSADVVIIHEDPLRYPELFKQYPLLHSKRTIAYAVWENEQLPNAYIQNLQHVDSIWTCSSFCQNAFKMHFDNVFVVPHVVKRVSPSPQDIVFAQNITQASDGAFLFYSVVDSINPRKNITGLVSLFSKVRSTLNKPIRLILKQYRAPIDYSNIPGVVSISDHLTSGQMAALHAVTDAYISPHHVEGWGLSLSASMAYGKPVIATGYSGNMEYMTTENSLPIPYTMETVSALMCERLPLFTPNMQWAQVDSDAFEAAMRKVALKKEDPSLPSQAARITRRFNKKVVGETMQRLLEQALATPKKALM